MTPPLLPLWACWSEELLPWGFSTRMDQKPAPQSSAEFRKDTASLHPLPDFQIPHPLANLSHKATPAQPPPATTPSVIAASSQTHHTKRPGWARVETYMG